MSRGGKEKEWIDSVKSNARSFDITVDCKSMAALKEGV